MSILVTILGKKDTTWDTLTTIMQSKEFDSIFLLTTATHQHAFTSRVEGAEFLACDFEKPVEELVVEFHSTLQKKFAEKKIVELDIAVCLASGTGKEHAALICALMRLGYGIRLIDVDATGELIEL